MNGGQPDEAAALPGTRDRSQTTGAFLGHDDVKTAHRQLQTLDEPTDQTPPAQALAAQERRTGRLQVHRPHPKIEQAEPVLESRSAQETQVPGFPSVPFDEVSEAPPTEWVESCHHEMPAGTQHAGDLAQGLMRLLGHIEGMVKDDKINRIGTQRYLMGQAYQGRFGQVGLPLGNRQYTMPQTAVLPHRQAAVDQELQLVIAETVGDSVLDRQSLLAQQGLARMALKPVDESFGIDRCHFVILQPITRPNRASIMNVTALPAFKDNYIWTLDDGRSAWVVDPGDARPVLDHLQRQRLELAGILVTHHHPDHSAGVPALLAHRTVPVAGAANSRVTGISVPLREGEMIEVLGTPFTVLEVPGHTLDHVAFLATALDPPLLFCGDTLFSAGCGRLFEGSPAQLFNSLEKMRQLPPATLIHCAHEYTLSNLEFARAVLGERPALNARRAEAEALRHQNRPTLPVTLSAELTFNPFLMTTDPQIKHSVEAHTGLKLTSALETFTALRRWKDVF